MWRTCFCSLFLVSISCSQVTELIVDGGFESYSLQTSSMLMPNGPTWNYTGGNASLTSNRLSNPWAPTGALTGNHFIAKQSSGSFTQSISSKASGGSYLYTWSLDVLARPGFTDQGIINIVSGNQTLASFNASTMTSKTRLSGTFIRKGAFTEAFGFNGNCGKGVSFDNFSVSYDPSVNAIHTAGIFTDHAVLQRNVPVPVWGWAAPNESLTLSFNGQTKNSTADASGKWSVSLDPMEANAVGQNLTVSSTIPNRSFILSNLLVGEVWMISGQSNSNWTVQQAPTTPIVSNPLFRVCTIPYAHPQHPAEDTTTSWVLPDSSIAKGSSAVGYIFGQKLQSELQVPVGVITCGRGGTYSEQWTPEQLVYDNSNYSTPYLKGFNARKLETGWTPSSPNRPGDLYNGMVSPVMPYSMKGVLWSQAEGSVWEFGNNHIKLGYMIDAWRSGFHNPNLAWIATAAAPMISHGANSTTAPLDIRPVQDNASSRSSVTLDLAASTIRDFWNITVIDAGARYDIHPTDKRKQGDRFAKMSLGKVYGQAIVAHGPKYSSIHIVGDKANVTFDSVGSGLVVEETNLDGIIASSDTLQGFEIAGADKVYYRANAKIVNPNTVEVSHPKVSTPLAVRFAWAPFPIFNLFNAEGFPPYPFTTDTWGWNGAAPR